MTSLLTHTLMDCQVFDQVCDQQEGRQFTRYMASVWEPIGGTVMWHVMNLCQPIVSCESGLRLVS